MVACFRSNSAWVSAMAGAYLALATHAHAETSDPALLAEAETIAAIAGDPAYGQYLGGECVTCHRQSGAAPGIPPIAGLPKDHFVLALVEYRAGARDNEVMVTTARRLSDEEIAALAAHFAAKD